MVAIALSELTVFGIGDLMVLRFTLLLRRDLAVEEKMLAFWQELESILILDSG